MKNVEKIDDSRAVGVTEYLRAADAAKKMPAGNAGAVQQSDAAAQR